MIEAYVMRRQARREEPPSPTRGAANPDARTGHDGRQWHREMAACGWRRPAPGGSCPHPRAARPRPPSGRRGRRRPAHRAADASFRRAGAGVDGSVADSRIERNAGHLRLRPGVVAGDGRTPVISRAGRPNQRRQVPEVDVVEVQAFTTSDDRRWRWSSSLLVSRLASRSAIACSLGVRVHRLVDQPADGNGAVGPQRDRDQHQHVGVCCRPLCSRRGPAGPAR